MPNFFQRKDPMRPMVNYTLINGKRQNGVDAIYMLHELSATTGKPFRDLGEARRVGREFQFLPKQGLYLKPCSSPRLKSSAAGKGLVAMLEEQIAGMRASPKAPNGQISN
jgi:hypothetical protein